MSNLNKIFLIGHLGDEVKIHHFEGGGCIGRVSIAVNETYKNKAGEKVENTNWFNLVFRNKLAEVIEKLTTKGDKLRIEGKLSNRQWQGEDGQTRYTTEINVNDFEFLSTKKSNNTTVNNPTDQNGKPVDDNDDLPF